MSTKVRTLLALIAGVALGLSLSLSRGVQASKEAPAAEPLPWQDARLLAEVLERVKDDYVDKVNDHDLMEAAVRGMISSLDPHSAFLDNDEYDEMRISTTGAYSGVGIEVTTEDGQVRVVNIIEGTPAEHAGILPGDIITGIDGIDVASSGAADAINRMRGKAGTSVKVRVTREGEPAPLDFSLERSNVQVHSVKHELLEPGFGYVRISHFSETTGPDVLKAIAALKVENKGKLTGLVLDLRNNPGGVLEAAVSVSDAFLDDGVIVTASGRAPDAKFEMDATPGDAIDGAPLVVLVNSGSASASEIVAGALKDHHRATLIGRTTFGKGSVQTVMPLSDGRALKLTTSRYYTPSGASIHQKGITPDVIVERAQEGALDTLAVVGTALVERDSEVALALSRLKGDGAGLVRQSQRQP
jgi:carboxyl-terminal processing protease